MYILTSEQNVCNQGLFQLKIETDIVESMTDHISKWQRLDKKLTIKIG